MWIIFKNIFSNFWDAPSWNRGRPDLTHGCHGCHGSSPFQQIHQSPICTIKHHNRSSASRGAATEKRHAMCHGPKMGLLMITMDIYELLWGISYNEYVIKLPFTWLVEQLVGRRATQHNHIWIKWAISFRSLNDAADIVEAKWITLPMLWHDRNQMRIQPTQPAVRGPDLSVTPQE